MDVLGYGDRCSPVSRLDHCLPWQDLGGLRWVLEVDADVQILPGSAGGPICSRQDVFFLFPRMRVDGGGAGSAQLLCGTQVGKF